MKKWIGITLIFLISSLIPGMGAIKISATGNLMFTADSDYQDIYGSCRFYPEFKLGYVIKDKILVWGGIGLISDQGKTPKLQLDAESSQTYLSLGIAYQGKIDDRFYFNAGVGVFSVSYKEKSMGTEKKGNALGFRIDGALSYNITDRIYIDFSLGYLTASDEIKVDGLTKEIKPGGFKTGIGIGLQF